MTITVTPFQTLYKKTSTGAIQVWTIWVEGSTIVTQYGQLDGKLQEARDTITEGKNIGRSNETTPEEQAIAEATAQWEKKQKKHYVLSLSDAQNGVVNTEIIQGGVLPMLAQSYDKHSHKINFPAFVQPKLDGHRCIAMKLEVGGPWTLWSRTQKPILGVPHIIAALDRLDVPDDFILDGELYNHEYRNRFEELTSFIKRPEPKAGHEVVEYHVYDFAHDTDAPFSYRYNWLDNLYESEDDIHPIVVVGTHPVESAEDLTEAFTAFVDQGYEGAIVRNAEGLYVNKRSYDLQKVKEFDDSEYEIIGVEAGRGKMADKAIFICQVDGDKSFTVKMKGSLDSLKTYLDDPSLAIGQKLTVQHQGLSADGIPRFAVGLRFRNDL